MIETLETGCLFTVTGDTREVIEDHLNEAIESAQDLAASEGIHGVLVTRQNGNAFTVEVSEEVSYGITMERWV